jgi:glycosyltransferase involved in cell wall biosynthesis
MPAVWAAQPGLHVYLVGSNPSPEVKALAADKVTVTGFVTDAELERHYTSARVAVAPLRYGGGMKGKVIEAMRFGLPIVTTSAGAQGLAKAKSFLPVADAPNKFAAEILSLVQDDSRWRDLSEGSLQFARSNFSLDAMERVFSEHMAFSDREFSEKTCTSLS